MVRRIGLLSALVGVCLAASVSPAAATVTLGSDLATAPTFVFGCSTVQNDRGCLFVNDMVPGRELVSPVDGVIVRWRVRLGASTQAQSIRIRVVRRFDASHFTVISSGALESVPAGAGTYTFPAQLPIRSGEQVAGEPNQNDIQWGAVVTGAHLFGYNPSPPDGDTTGDPVFDDPDVEVTLNADVDPTNTFSLGAVTRNKKKGTATIAVNDIPNPGDLTGSGKGVKASSAGQAVTSKSVGPGQAKLLIKAKGKKKKKLNQKGKVTLKVAVTYTPTGGSPNTQSVKVKLKKKLKR